MGRQSKAAISRLNNLTKRGNPKNPSVEDVYDDEGSELEDEDYLEQGFFFLDEGTPLEEDSDGSDSEEEEISEDELNGLQNEADIEHFNAVLAHAQAMAVKAEREAAGEKPKRKRHYTGNSDRTKQHHAQKRRELGITGQKFISSMFSKKATGSTTCVTEGARDKPTPEIIEIADGLDDDDDDEIEASLKQLFLSMNRQVFVQPVNRSQSHHKLPRAKSRRYLRLEKRLQNCFDTFEKVDGPTMTVQ